MRILPLCLASLLVFLAGPHAQSGEPTRPPIQLRLSAVSAGEPWRPPSGIVIETQDTDLDGIDGPRVTAVRDAINRALTARGIPVAGDGSHVLNFRVSSAPSPAPPDEPDVGGGPPRPSPGERYRPVEVTNQVTVPLDPKNDAGVSSDFAISFMLFVPGEEPVWNATVTASGEVETPSDLLSEMTRVAMAALGASEERSFTVTCAAATAERGGSCQP